MKDTLIFQVIQTLDKREIREIKKFLASPYFNQREDVQLLFAFLTENQQTTAWTKEKIFVFLFPKDKKYNDNKMRLASSLLLQLIEDFWAIEAKKANINTKKCLVVAQYRIRKLDKLFLRTFNEAKQSIDNQLIRNADFHLQQYELLSEAYRFDSATRKESEHLQNISESLDNAYYSLKLRQACLTVSYQAVFKTAYEQNMISEILAHIETKKLYKIPSVGIYYFAYKSLIDTENTTHFFELKTMLFEFGTAFPPDEIRDLYLIAINYCIQKHNKGEVDFLKIEFELYQKGLKDKCLYIDNFITKFTYRNVVTLALTLRELDRAETFIEENKDELEPSQREGNYKHACARLAYERKNYNKVLELLQKADYDDVLISLAAKALLLKSLYETAAYDALEAHLEAMRAYIKRKSKIAYHQENYLNLIKFTKQLLLILPLQKEHLKQLETKVEATKAIAEKKWLLTKVKALI